jgi:signal transduction histidine kinase
VRATPVQCGGSEFTVFVLTDVSAAKRRDALQRLFFHDILNTIGGLRIWTSVLEKGGETRMQTAAAEISQLASYLGREVHDQRRLLEAEAGTLTLDRQPVPVGDLLEEVRRICRGHAAAEGRTLIVEAADPDAVIETDRLLLRRVLTNMAVNALEAVGEGAVVRLRHQGSGQRHVFRVHNPGVIPADVAPRIFSRSFSTKGTPGRGLGTYSMKLFGERYLGGRVGFASTPASGTTFSIRLPLRQESAPSSQA